MSATCSNAAATNRRRAPALVAVSVLLFAQLLGAAHTHRYEFRTSIASAAQSTGGESHACPICLSTLHVPLTVSSVSWVACSPDTIGSISERPAPSYTPPALTSAQGRAPPSSV